MTPKPEIMTSVEKLGYRVTVGDVAAQAGLKLNLAQQGLLALASDAGGHLQVAESGEIVYLFPQNFRTILRNKYWKLRLQETWEKVWKVLFYLIRVSFGVILIASIILMMITIAIIIIGINSSRNGDSDSQGGNDRNSGGLNFFFFPNFSDLFWIFYPNRYDNRYEYQSQEIPKKGKAKSEINFLEGIFSFLFGDGNPNYDLEERRWQEIGSVIRNNKGAIVAEQVAPYLDNITQYNQENEDYILPVLIRFNGSPEVSPAGGIIYYFPELQVTVQKQTKKSVASYLEEKFYRFSRANSGQIMLSIGLGALNFILALVLGSFLKDPALVAQFGGLVAFVNSIYWILLAYATAFLSVPLMRYFWIQWQNSKIESRNIKRQQQVENLQQIEKSLQEKLDYAHQFAAEKFITQSDITYTTEKDVLEQEIERSEQIDKEWQRRLMDNE
ncbi:hypothetical protein [Aphanothece sacrum]|uniref:Uncharacterized protein n=1 Tax=Aphanothece sacrum FPU1 TaxID=1920663 RepID=A0A401ILN9_APHSA|nr:hypothetical protein [Aphanothece sacrum]GBF82162.1 hypothetical protein AsFPU1_3589 [Aphanothece sacrum FPU1]GBF85873.1 hypothetical protein AsFPU3_2942 [Aphanothece sacrum FPU3]